MNRDEVNAMTVEPFLDIDLPLPDRRDGKGRRGSHPRDP